MDVTVERYMRRKIVTDSASPQFFYLRQKPGTCKTVDVDTLAAAIQKKLCDDERRCETCDRSSRRGGSGESG